MYQRNYPRHSHCRPHPAHARRHSIHRGRGGPRARRGDVRAAVLALLAERPMHGHEMIKELEERTEGTWRPSAGSIYPMLQLLEDEGLIRGEEADGKRRFALTDEGRTEQDAREGDAPWDEVRDGVPAGMIGLGQSARQLSNAVRQVFHAANAEQRRQATELLDETRRKIYAILAEEG